MAKVEIDESVVEVQHESALADKNETKDEGEKKKAPTTIIDVDTLVDICVERVFDLLKVNYDR